MKNRIIAFLLSLVLLMSEFAVFPARVGAAESVTDDGFVYTSDGESITITGYSLSEGENQFSGFEYGGHYYGFAKNAVSWNTALALCAENGGYLVTVTSAEEQTAIENGIATFGLDRCWIGATDEAEEGVWRWVTGEEFSYSNWASSQPDNYNGIEDYAGYFGSNQWNDYEMSPPDIVGYICEWEEKPSEDIFTELDTELVIPSEIDGLPVVAIGDSAFANNKFFKKITVPESVTSIGASAFSGCTAKEIVLEGAGGIKGLSYNGHNYAMFDLGISWNEAENICEAVGGHLVTITDENEQLFVQSMLEAGGRISWIGLSDSKTEGAFEWVTGEELSYSLWSSGEPNDYNGGEEYCGIYLSDYGYGWNDFKEVADEVTAFICEWDRADVAGFENVSLEENILNTGYTIGQSAFRGCTFLEAFEIPAGVLTVDEYVFEGCVSLKSVTIPETAANIRSKAFQNCTSLESITIPENTKAIYSYSFGGCTSLKDVNLPEGLETIYSYAFNGCTALESVDIPDSVTALAARAFYNCIDLSEVGYPAGWKSVLDYSNNGTSASSGSSSYRSPFDGCTALTHVTVDEGVTKIPSYAFRYHTVLESIDLPESLETVGAYAFDGCTSLKGFELNNVTKLNVIEFGGHYYGLFDIHLNWNEAKELCENLGGHLVTVADENEQSVVRAFVEEYGKMCWLGATDAENEGEWRWVTGEEFSYTCWDSRQPDNSGNEDYLANFLSNYNYNWNDATVSASDVYGFICEWESIDSFEGNEFSVVTDEGSAVNANCYIGDYAFRNCSALESISLDETYMIGSYAFQNCKKLKNVTVPEGCLLIKTYAFSGCSALESISLQEGVTDIQNYAFNECTALENVELPGSLTYIKNYAFNKCTSLESIDIPSGVKAIYPYAFNGCTFLKDVTFNEGLEVIGYSAFKNTAVEEIVIPKSIWMMNFSSYSNSEETSANYRSDSDASAFYGSKLRKITFTEGETKINLYSLKNCTLLEEVIIPDTVTTIGKYAFSGCTALRSIDLPDGISEIGTYAFAESGLTSAMLPEGLVTLDEYTFSGCKSLTEVIFPSSLTYIKNCAFQNCTALAETEIPESVKAIYPNAFSGCTFLKDVTFNEGLEVIGYSAFKNTAVEEIVIPKSVWMMNFSSYSNSEETSANYRSDSDASAFYGSKLRKVTFAEGETKINFHSFKNCTLLEEVIIPETVTTISEYAFRGCTALKEIYLPDSVSTIGRYAFAETGLASVKLPESLVTIDEYTLYGCKSLAEVIFPSSLTYIKNYAFHNCTALTDIEIPASVKAIYTGAFYGCSSLKDVTFNEGLEVIGASAFRKTAVEEVVIPKSVWMLNFSSYSNAEETSAYYSTDTNASAFYESKLRKVTFAEGETKINFYSFRNCTLLEEVVIPESLKTISERAFQGCTSLKTIDIPDSVSVIEKYAFADTGLKSIKLPESLVTIDEYTFSGCKSLSDITFTPSIKYIKNYAFQNSTALTELDIPGNVKAIYTGAFYGCSSLKDVTFNEGLEVIGASAFRKTAVEEVVIPKSVWMLNFSSYSNAEETSAYYSTDTNASAFYESKLRKVTFAEGETKINFHSFKNCSLLEEVVLPDTLKTIGARAFEGCTALRAIDIPSSVETIEEYAFASCKQLPSLIIPSSVTTLGRYAFSGCTGLQNLTFEEDLEKPIYITEHNGHYYAIFDQTCSWENAAEFCLNKGGYLASITDAEEQAFIEDIMSFGTKEVYSIGASDKDVEGVWLWESGEEFSYTNWSSGEPDNKKNVSSAGENYLQLYKDGGKWLDNDNTSGNYKWKTIGFICEWDELPEGNYVIIERPNDPVALDKISEGAFNGCTNITDVFYNENKELWDMKIIENNNTPLDNSEKHFAHDHVFGDWITKEAATCSNVGERYRVCIECGYTEYEYVDKLPHDYEEAVTEPTCTKGGYTVFTCVNCGYTYTGAYTNALGHSHELVSEIPATCTERGTRYYECIRCDSSYTTNTQIIDHDFGEWVIDKEPTLLSEGSKHRSCKMCGYTENEVIPRLEKDYMNDDGYGLANFTVVNAQTLEPIENAQLYIATTYDGEGTFSTNAEGKVSVVLPVGSQIVSAYATGCLTRNVKITIEPGVNDLPPIGLSPLSTYDAKLTSTPMTIEEIEAAGIDTSDPANQHVYKYELTLKFSPEIDYVSIVSYFNEGGKFLGGGGGTTKPEGPSGPEPGTEPDTDPSTGKPVYKVHYHVIQTNHNWCSVDYYDAPGTYSLTYYPERDDPDYIFDGWYEDDKFTKKVTTATLEEYETWVYGRWIYIGEGPEPNYPEPIKINPGDDEEEEITVYPVSENFYLIIRGEVRWLKEMFDVEMLIINNSMTDTLEDLDATLTLPEGLSLAAMIGEEQTLTQHVDRIEEGGCESVHWFVRGDTAGSYGLEARLTGMVMPFEEPIDQTFKSENQLQVWAGNAMHLHFEFPNATFYGDNYPITITLTNVSDKPIYNISHAVQVVQGMEIYYSDGTDKKRIQTSDWYTTGIIREFNPGDKIVISLTVNIFFESELIKYQLEKLTGIVDGIESLINGYNAFNTVLDMADSITGFISGASTAIDKFVGSAGGGSDKMNMFRELYGSVNELSAAYGSAGQSVLGAASTVTSSGISAELEAISEDPEAWYNSHSEAEIEELSNRLQTVGKAISEDDVDTSDFNIFDSIRTAIMAIPVRFVLQSVTMKEDENNTTSIPWSYSTTNTGARYFGVSSVSKYLEALVIAGMGEAYEEYMPWYVQLLDGTDDPMGKEEAIRYIKATEKEIAKFKAKDATGEVTFRAWIERNPAAYNMRNAAALSATDDFVLSCDNENAIYEDGVLTFTGDSVISVEPLNMNGGILYIEDSEGGLTTYAIEVVEQHECAAGECETVLAPTEATDGFGVKKCVVCDDILEIISMTSAECEHDLTAWEVKAYASCTMLGMEERTCTVCGMLEQSFVDMAEHTEGEWTVTVQPTCTEEGESHTNCTVCGKDLYKAVDMVPHTEGEWRISKEATAFATGTEELHCAVCDTVLDTAVIPMTKETFGLDLDNETRIVSGFDAPVTTAQFIAHYANMGMTVTVKDASGRTPGFVGTGCIATYEDVEFRIAVKGDMNGDGKLNARDSLRQKTGVAQPDTLDEVMKIAADINGDGRLNARDTVAMKKKLSV